MTLNSKKNKRLASLVLLVLIVFLGYLSNRFIPEWVYNFDHKTGEASLNLKEEDGVMVVDYVYYNEYLSKEIKNRREIKRSTYADFFRDKKSIDIKYPKYFYRNVLFVGIDEEPSLLLGKLLIYLGVIVAIILYINVLRDKITLEMLLGVNKPNSEELQSGNE